MGHLDPLEAVGIASQRLVARDRTPGSPGVAGRPWKYASPSRCDEPVQQRIERGEVARVEDDLSAGEPGPRRLADDGSRRRGRPPRRRPPRRRAPSRARRRATKSRDRSRPVARAQRGRAARACRRRRRRARCASALIREAPRGSGRRPPRATGTTIAARRSSSSAPSCVERGGDVSGPVEADARLAHELRVAAAAAVQRPAARRRAPRGARSSTGRRGSPRRSSPGSRSSAASSRRGRGATHPPTARGPAGARPTNVSSNLAGSATAPSAVQRVGALARIVRPARRRRRAAAGRRRRLPLVRRMEDRRVGRVRDHDGLDAARSRARDERRG